ncbi:MAG: dihydropteroate synthase [Candidatus Meridianibacter frigidus]|nr:MAG: dihydropteroate synthase [Candidatus Eremiobacteraeota bacterium]
MSLPKLSRSSSRGALNLRGRSLQWGARTYLMGIVNATPDSFSGDGRPDASDAVDYAVRQSEQTADIIDVGAESTRPGHTPLSEAVERERLLPVLAGIRGRLGEGVIVSADTFKANIFRDAHAAGADILNSIWGMPDELLAVAAELRVPVVIMHNKAVAIYENDVVDEVVAFLAEAAERAVRAGIPAEHVIVDPGIGFGKDADHNIAVLQSLDRLVSLGFPTLLGTSRKSTIGKLTGREPEERTYGTAATIALGIAAGIDIVRVHDVAQMRDAVSVSDAIERGWRPHGWT